MHPRPASRPASDSRETPNSAVIALALESIDSRIGLFAEFERLLAGDDAALDASPLPQRVASQCSVQANMKYF